MKCSSCGCENGPQEKFCKNCGIQLIADNGQVIRDLPPNMMNSWGDDTTTTPLMDEDDGEGATTLLTSELKTPGVVSGAEPVDDSEANTTVLTSELRTPGVQAGGFTPVQPGTNAPGGFTPVQPGANAPGGFTPVQPGANAPGGFTPVQPGANGPGGFTPVPPESKKGKPEKVKKEKKAKTPKPEKAAKPAKQGGTGKAYMIASIAVMVILAGAGAAFFLIHTSKINDLNAEVASLTDANASYEADNTDKDKAIADYEKEIDQLKKQTSDDEATIASLKEDVDDYSDKSDYYANYNGLIEFANDNTGASSTTMFASDTVLHMTKDETLVYVYVTDKSEINCSVENKDVASIEWVGWENDNVAILKVIPGKEIGSTRITIVKGNGDADADSGEEDTSEESGDGEEASEEEAEESGDSTEVVIFVYND
jgi:type II secretory pathway pseudopilin PulG